MYGIRGRGLYAWAGVGLLPMCAVAASPSTPGSIGDTLKQPPALQPPAPAPPISTQQNKAPAGAEQGATVVVTQFIFSGNTVFGTDVLGPLVAGYLNRPISLAQIYEAADKVADFYASQGYPLASVNVPAQKVKNGSVRLEVIEGRIGKIGFDGNRRYRSTTLSSFMTQTKPDEVYRSAPLEHDLQSLNALPGVAARAVIQPGASYGSSDVTVKVEEDPIDGYVVLDNYGRKDSGEYRTSAAVTLNNPFTIADQLQVLGTHSDANRLNYGYVDYNLPLTSGGLRLDANYGHAYFKTAPFDVSGKNNNLQLSLTQPWIRTAATTFLTSVGYIHTNANADLVGIPISQTNINLLNLGATYAHVWSSAAVTQYVASIHTNFSESSPADRNHERFRFEINLQHLQPLPAHLQLLGLIDAVYSPDPLADTEQFSIGGPTSIRGFPSSEARGDCGYFAQLTLRRPFSFGRFSVVPRIFGDSGRVKTLDFDLVPDNSNSLTSAGVGTDLIYRSFNVKVDWSYPIDSRPVSDGRNDGRVYAALSAGF